MQKMDEEFKRMREENKPIQIINMKKLDPHDYKKEKLYGYEIEEMEQEVKFDYDQIISNLLVAIDNNYCSLKNWKNATENTKVLDLTTNVISKLFKSETLKTSHENLVAEKTLTRAELKAGTIAVAELKSKRLFDSARNCLATFLDKLKDVTSLNQLLVQIYKSKCLDDNDFSNKMAKTLLSLVHVEKINNKKDLTMWKAAQDYKLDVVMLLQLICREAAGELNTNTEHTAQQLVWFKDNQTFKGNEAQYKLVENYKRGNTVGQGGY